MINKLILGTVQLGLDYGINNSKGKPTLENAFKILTTAFDNGITVLDTAEAYGNSQEVIGLFHKKHPNKQFKIITKIAPNSVVTETDLIVQIQKNCKQLNVELLYAYMFHHYNVLIENKIIYHNLIKAKEKGLVQKIGISLYTNTEIEDIINNYTEFDIIQIPFNLFDNENQRKKIILKARKKGMEIHTRSVFLQGLFFMDKDKIPKKTASLSDDLLTLKELQQTHKLDTVTMALQYVLQKKYIDCVVIGVDSSKQLISNINMVTKTVTIPHQEIDTISVKDITTLNPSNW